MDWSVRQVELEGETESGFETATESEITSEVQGQPGSFGRAELNFEGVMEDAQTSLMEEAAQKQAQRQQAWEQAQGQSVSMNTAWDSQSDFLGDLGTAFDLEAETKVALEQEFETQQESNIEQEWEQEFEQELEYEYEKESELFGKNQNNQRQQNLLTAFGSFSKRYKNPIASAEEVLGWK